MWTSTRLFTAPFSSVMSSLSRRVPAKPTVSLAAADLPRQFLSRKVSSEVAQHLRRWARELRGRKLMPFANVQKLLGETHGLPMAASQ